MREKHTILHQTWLLRVFTIQNKGNTKTDVLVQWWWDSQCSDGGLKSISRRSLDQGTSEPENSQMNWEVVTTLGIFSAILSCCGLGPAARSLLHAGGMGRRKYNKKLVGRDKDREGSLTSYGHRQNRLDLGKKEINLICYQSNQSRMMRNRTIS